MTTASLAIAAPPSPGSVRLNPLARRAARRDGIPVLRGAFPLLGHAPALFAGTLDLVRLAERELGPLFWLDLGFGRQVVCYAHPDAWQLFKSKAVSSAHAQDLPVDLLGRRSLIATDGPAHARVRGALNATFAPRGLTGLALGPAFAEMITARLATWPGRGAFRLLGETRDLVLSLMFRMSGIVGAEVSEWRRHYERSIWLGINMPEPPGSPRWFAQRSRRWLESRLRALIAEARANPGREGLIAALVAARDEHGEPLEEEQLVDNLRLLVLAGHETSASTMAWATAVCAVRDDVWSGLCEEALAAGELPRSPAELRSFPYAEGVFREALRLYPPASIDMRRVVGPLELAGLAVPIGTDVLMPIVHLSRDPELYPDPDRFQPERWVRKGAPLTPAELVQFGAGAHFCLGYHVAWMEIVQYLVALARTLAPRGLRPRLEGRFPSPRFLPIAHPEPGVRIRVDRA